jgi:hypothetical protein
MKVIELKDVKKSYGKNEILHGISLDIRGQHSWAGRTQWMWKDNTDQMSNRNL